MSLVVLVLLKSDIDKINSCIYFPRVAFKVRFEWHFEMKSCSIRSGLIWIRFFDLANFIMWDL